MKKSVIKIAAVAVSLIVMFISGIVIEKIFEKKRSEKDQVVLVMDEIEPAEETEVAVTISLDEINAKISNIGELATVEYMYTDAGKFSSNMKFEYIDFLEGVDIPFTEKSFIVRWDGCIKAGIEFGEISCAVDDERKLITVSLPKAKILSHEIDTDSFETLDESGSIFNPIKVDDVNLFVGSSMKHMEEKVKGNDLLVKAEENARTLIKNSLISIPVVNDEYKIVFEYKQDTAEAETEETEELQAEDEG